jgi:FKBP-type peptidyl-prolyl cis-trans isomerase
MMVVGEKVRVWIPFNLAYQTMPSKPQGPLVFEIELIEIK